MGPKVTATPPPTPPEDEAFADFSAAHDDVAREVAELVTGGTAADGAPLAWAVTRAASEIRSGNLDAALANLDEADGYIDAIREKVRALARGEIPQ